MFGLNFLVDTSPLKDNKGSVRVVSYFKKQVNTINQRGFIMIGQNKDCKVKVHVDGNYAFGVWNYLRAKGKTLNWDKLFQYILRFLDEKVVDSSPIIDKSISYCFMGDAAWHDEDRGEFRHELLKAGIDSKLKPLKKVDNRYSDGSLGYKEDGVDALNIAHTFYDAFVGAGANAVPSAQYSYLVMFAGDSDFASTFDLLHTIGVKIIVVYLDTDKAHRSTSDLIINSADYTVSLESLLYDRGDALAQSIFEPVRFANPVKKLSKPIEIAKPQVCPLDTNTGIVKFIDIRTREWGIISGPDGDYHFFLSDVRPGGVLSSGSRVQFNALKHPLPNDGSKLRAETNGKATDVTIVSTENAQPLMPAVNAEKAEAAIPATSHVSEDDLKELVRACPVRENGFALLSEVGFAYKFKFGKPERPLKDILGDYPATFEFCNAPAASVRVRC